ncbi:MAG: DUF898 domain-containing protein [Epsilonproteobacteria bacterium]|nr:DUF898 domain-containing protein [Campylobacterota bacterium]
MEEKIIEQEKPKTPKEEIAEYKPFVFKGDGKEFFRIWIVNIALTILTLGIYSAWAKVRTNRYFYANTYLNESNFEYNAKPQRILVGRVIVVGLYGLFLLFFQYLGMYDVAIGIFVIALLAMPWLVRQAISFKLRNTSYRNIPFRYAGKTSSFYYLFLVNGLLPLIIIMAISAFIPIPFLSLILFFIFFGYVYIKFKELTITNSYYGNARFRFLGVKEEVYGIYFKIMGWMILFMAGISTFIGLLALLVSIIGGESSEVLTQFASQPDANIENVPDTFWATITPILTLLVYLPIIFLQKGLSDGYFSNFVRNNTLLQNAKLKGDINPLKLAWISATNVMALIFSLGLLYPWTKVRYIKYKLEHTYFKCSDYDQFKSLGYEEGSTIGEETLDFFDIDIGL